MAESITARLSDTDVKAIDALVKAGHYSTRSDFLRAATRHFLREEAPEIPKIFIKMQKKAKEKRITRKRLLLDIRHMRKKMYKEQFE